MDCNELLGLRGKTALVLGGGQGMGEATATLLARSGVRVAVADREQERARKIAEQIGGGAISLDGDILDDATLARLIADSDAALNGIDILVCIVGLATFKPALDLTAEDWDTDQRRNLRYVFLASQAFAKAAIARGKPGAIGCLSSMSGVRSAAGHAAYGAAKNALVNLVRTLAVEWSGAGIRINAVTPGSIAVPSYPDSPELREIMSNSLVPMKRAGTTDEIARALLFLCSDMASYTTGHNLYVDGGWGAANLFG